MTQLAQVHGFTRDEWLKALSIDMTDQAAAERVSEMFALHEQFGSDGFAFDHSDLLRLAYVNEDCRARVLALFEHGDRISAMLLDKLRLMDRDMRAREDLRHSPASPPL